jgi:signal transduction histidine kinase
MNLIWKIFITFGIAMTLTLVVTVVVTLRLSVQASDQLNIQNREEIIAQAATALDDGGEPELRSWLRKHPRSSPGVMLMIVDEDGEDLLGREVPERYDGLLKSLVFRRARPENLRPMRMTPQLVANDGRLYRLLFARTQVTVLGILTWPATQFSVLTLVILAAAATALPLAPYLSLPIVRLQRASRALAAGALDTRVGGPYSRRKDEVGTLARDFDAMAEQIQALVTSKEILLRDVSHELRSPLARIRVALALAQRKANEASQPDLDRIEDEAEHLDELIGQVMTLARLRTPVVTEHQAIDLDGFVSEVVENARFEHSETEIQYAPQTVPLIQGDPAELKSAIENVVRNALGHGSGKTVRVKLRKTDRHAEVCVSDRGPGVPDSDLKRIFEPFYRADTSRDHQHGGQGIGLAITASVMERHAGQVTATNRAEGGLEVVLKLPSS